MGRGREEFLETTRDHYFRFRGQCIQKSLKNMKLFMSEFIKTDMVHSCSPDNDFFDGFAALFYYYQEVPLFCVRLIARKKLIKKVNNVRPIRSKRRETSTQCEVKSPTYPVKRRSSTTLR